MRKAGKLPRATLRAAYALEYGEAVVEIHADACLPSQRVVIIDDLLATGGTARATCELIEKLGGTVVACCFVIELGFLPGRAALAGVPVVAILTF